MQLNQSTVMLAAMKRILLMNLLLSATCFSFTADAELYKGLDAEGEVVYSDKPFTNSKKFTPPPLSVVASPKVAPQKTPTAEAEESAEFKYTDFDITSPTSNQTIWDEPNVTVSLALKPDLNTVAGHSVWILMDDKAIIKNSQETNIPIGRLDRGSHQLQAQIRDQQGKMVIRSRAVVVHIKHTAIRRQVR